MLRSFLKCDSVDGKQETCVSVCVVEVLHTVSNVGLAGLRQRGNLAEQRLLYEPKDACREVNISVTILKRWSFEVPRTSEESVRYCNFMLAGG